MTLARREQTLAAMLERFHELATPERGQGRYNGNGTSLDAGHEPGCQWIAVDLVLHPEHKARCTCWVAAVAELERCLTVMRQLGRQRSVPYHAQASHDKPDRGEERTMPLSFAYQQLRWWYVDAETYPVPVYVTRVKMQQTLHGRRWVKVRERVGSRLEAHRHPDAREAKAVGALRYLSALYRGEPQLPPAQVRRAA